MIMLFQTMTFVLGGVLPSDGKMLSFFLVSVSILMSGISLFIAILLLAASIPQSTVRFSRITRLHRSIITLVQGAPFAELGLTTAIPTRSCVEVCWRTVNEAAKKVFPSDTDGLTFRVGFVIHMVGLGLVPLNIHLMTYFAKDEAARDALARPMTMLCSMFAIIRLSLHSLDDRRAAATLAPWLMSAIPMMRVYACCMLYLGCSFELTDSGFKCGKQHTVYTVSPDKMSYMYVLEPITHLGWGLVCGAGVFGNVRPIISVGFSALFILTTIGNLLRERCAASFKLTFIHNASLSIFIAFVLANVCGFVIGVWWGSYFLRRRVAADDAARAAATSPANATASLQDTGFFECPITCELLKDPVTAPDGHTYERKAIEGWLTVNATSPMTGMPMTIDSKLETNWMTKEMLGRI